MNRAIIFRIVGFGFLVFAAVSIYRGEFEMAMAGGAVVTRVHNPEAFWRVVVIQVGIGCTLLYLSRSAGTTPDRRQQPDADGHSWMVPVLRNPAVYDVGALHDDICLSKRVTSLSAHAP